MSSEIQFNPILLLAITTVIGLILTIIRTKEIQLINLVMKDITSLCRVLLASA